MAELVNSKKLLGGLVVIGSSLYKELKDGVNISKDAVALLDDLVKEKQKLFDAYEAAKFVVEEFKNAKAVDFIELGLELGNQAVEFLKEQDAQKQLAAAPAEGEAKPQE